MNKAIFLDRDGTIIWQFGDTAIYTPKELIFLPQALQGLHELSKLDYKLIIVTNQSGIGKGLYTEKQFREVMKYMYKQFKKVNKEFGLNINVEKQYYFCGHHPDAKCHCRKPEPGMLEQAIKDFNIDPWQSWMIGDNGKDIDAGASVGCRTILVETGLKGIKKQSLTDPTYRVLNLWRSAIKIKNTA